MASRGLLASKYLYDYGAPEIDRGHLAETSQRHGCIHGHVLYTCVVYMSMCNPPIPCRRPQIKAEGRPVGV